MNIRKSIPNCDVIPSTSASFSDFYKKTSSDETKIQEAINEEQHKHRSSSTFSCNFNHAPDSNGESADIIERINFRSTISLVDAVATNSEESGKRQYKHRWNYASHHPKIQHSLKEWTIAIILKLLLVAWDMWTYCIGFKFNNFPTPWEI